MNRFISGFLILVLCSSCSVYQYNVLWSDIPGKANEPFTLENDTLRLSYSFADGQGSIEIFNKSAKPLYVDWSRAALIVNAHSQSFWSDDAPVDPGTEEYDSLPSDDESYTTGDVTDDTHISFIAPGSAVWNRPFNVRDKSHIFTDDKPDYRQYTAESSPLKFRSYLMLSFDENFSDPIIMDHTFWLAESRQSRESMNFSQKQNIYSSTKETRNGNVATGVFVLALIYLEVLVGD